jgi:PAS domain S-box-containing protein
MADISERKRAERTLRASEAKYRTLVENIPQKIFMKDTNFRWVSINERFARDLGIRPDEAVGKLDIDFFPKDLADKYRADDERILRTGNTENIEEKYLQEGKEYWVHTIKTPVKDDNGVTIGALGIFWDITERKNADAELARYRDHLEELVRHRTNELEAMNKELESFSYSVSHDLRAPLRTIDGFSLALMEDYCGKFDETGMDHLRRVRAATLRMAQLIDDLLKLSRVSRGELRIERADLGALARSVERELEKTEPKRKVDFVVGTDLVVDGDAPLLRVVMENLLSNAWKFTGKHPEATVTVGRMEKAGETIFFVRDDGAGFDMAYVGKLFGPFQRLHSLEEFPGSGIGLATVQRIVHRHGGRIWAEGAVEKGATFWFTLNPADNKNPTKKEKEAGEGK